MVITAFVAVSVACGADDENSDVIPITPPPTVTPTATSLLAAATPVPPSLIATVISSLEPPAIVAQSIVPTATMERAVAIPATTGVPTETLAPTAAILEFPIGLPGATSYIYWLSDVDLDVIAAEHPSVTVIDYAFDGSNDTAFSAEEIEDLRAAMRAPAWVIVYVSIGEAEEYRYYWQDDWSPGSPDWIVQENPDWEGNFKVEFWDDEWQAHIFGNSTSYLDRVIAVGFDGVYLDIIDAYEFFEERGVTDARQRMIDFVIGLSEYAKSKNPEFLIVPQNAPELGEDQAYLDVVDGIGMESVYYGYEFKNVATDPAITLEIEAALFRFRDAGKFVLTTDYAISSKRVQDAYKRSRANGFLPTVTEVDLADLPVREPSR